MHKILHRPLISKITYQINRKYFNWKLFLKRFIENTKINQII